MGQIFVPSTKDIILTSVDRLQARNAGAGNVGNNVIFLGVAAGQNNTQNNVIAIGSNALAGGLNDVNGRGTIILGSEAAPVMTDFTTGAYPGSSIIIGYKAANILGNGPSNVLIGDSILALAAGGASSSNSGNVLIGYHIAQLAAPTNASGNSINGCVMLGQRIMGNSAGNQGALNCVIIGSEACRDMSGTQPSNNIVIGRLAGRTLNSVGNILIGSQCCQTLTGGDGVQAQNTIIGDQAAFTGLNNTVLGAGTVNAGGSHNTYVGFNIGSLNNFTGSRCVFLGSGSGEGETNSLNDTFCVETNFSGTRRAIVYGRMEAGNVILGNSIPGTNRDFRGTTPPTNALKLLNGTVGTGANPSAGGFFYVTAGVLHWFDQNGVDSTVSVGTAGQLDASIGTAYTNNAAAQAATITNGPTAGNPTKWIPINDNGTIRNIPAW